MFLLHLLSVILIDSVFKIGKNYPQLFLEECRYIVKKKINKYINDDHEISSDDSNEDASDWSDERTSNKEQI